MPRTYTVASLKGAHVLLTGATGFIGQAVLERLLADHPDTRVTLLMRGRGGCGARDRLVRLLRKDVFRRWHERPGGAEALAEAGRRVQVVEGDLADVPELPDDIDTVIHCASAVTFDPPIDEAFRSNVTGAAGLCERLARQPAPPHLVYVSTAFVSAPGHGQVREEPLGHRVDWRQETASAERTRAEVERDSRRPEVLRGLLREARRAHGPCGNQVVAAQTEAARSAWVERRLVEYGRARATSLGWTDVYTFTKALAERATEELWAGRPLTVLRPAIVESALRHPYPGWIDGHKMLDPLIIDYGTGTMWDLPGAEDAVLDVIPVDLVVNAVLAAAAAPAAPGAPHYFHVGSGTSNPLTYGALHDHLDAYFRRHPLPDPAGFGHLRHARWKFHDAGRVRVAIGLAERATAAAASALEWLPTGERTLAREERLHQRRGELARQRHYFKVYQPYTGAQARYDDRELLALHRALPPQRAAEHGFDPRQLDWRDYLQEVHCPGVTRRLRDAMARRAEVGRGGGQRPVRALPSGEDVAAVFDLDGTVVAADMVESYLWARLASGPLPARAVELLDLLRSAPRYLHADRGDRAAFVRAFLRRYRGADEAELHTLVREALADALLRRVLPDAVRRVREHRAAGHRTVLVTGSLEVLVEPLRPLFDEVVGCRLESRGGVLSGRLAAPPVVGEARAAWLREYARERGLSLHRSYGYADSYSDRPFLSLVGRPCAVNPELRLYRYAARHHWPVVRWGAHPGTRWEALADAVVAGARHEAPRSEA
ncbi:HAD-IB family hydrolase [Streptomyces sp. 796.1]|uniref:HAD-IB family hydrolase n=1 Tax=Streptomyces sp. 796.1 TaxID=3163029 RepID=UPI0039C9CE36